MYVSTKQKVVNRIKDYYKQIHDIILFKDALSHDLSTEHLLKVLQYTKLTDIEKDKELYPDLSYDQLKIGRILRPVTERAFCNHNLIEDHWSEILKASRIVKKEQFYDHPFMQNIKYQEKEYDELHIKKIICHTNELFLFDSKKDYNSFAYIPSLGIFEEDVEIDCLCEGDSIIFNYLSQPIQDAENIIQPMHGKVLFLGDDMGFFMYALSEKTDVDSVTLVNPSSGFIKLWNDVAEQCPNKQKIEIIHQKINIFLNNIKDGDYDYILYFGEGLMDILYAIVVQNYIRRFNKTKIIFDESVDYDFALKIYFIDILYDKIAPKHKKQPLFSGTLRPKSIFLESDDDKLVSIINAVIKRLETQEIAIRNTADINHYMQTNALHKMFLEGK